jgi:group I intron endonuclease
MSIYTIYKSVNTKTGKVYIGFDSNWPNRFNTHKSASKNQDYKFYRAIRKYGWNSFEWSIIYQSKDKQHTLKEMESYFISEYNSMKNGYNSTLGGDGCFGMILSAESRKLISMKNKIPKPHTPEHNKKIGDANRGKKRKPLSDEHKAKISQKSKGISKPMSEQHKKNLKCHQNNLIKVSCPHCNKMGQLTNMKRWHFDNCKTQVQSPS